MSSRWLYAAAGGLLLASGGMIGTYLVASGDAQAAAAPVDDSEAPLPVARGAEDLTAFLSGDIELRLGDRSARVPWSELGVGPDGTVDRAAAMAALRALDGKLSTPPANARLDLEARRLVPDQAGLGVDPYGGVVALEGAIAERATAVALPVAAVPADVTADDLGNMDISVVMGSFTTKFSVAEKSRNHNLKLAASKLNGYVLKPGEEFSFNAVVGSRDAEDGYKIAPVITSGELVDGLAGGTCQISTTLHGASFFAGLEIVKSTPHSRPSTYVHMGLDATVVWPVTDLVMRNPYDFPVVIHYTVARGEAVVEILGPGRPFDEIAFEREIDEEIPFQTVTREDDTLPVGSMVIEQEGFPGYKMKRYRRYYKDGKVVKNDKWNLRYAPVTEYIRIGTNPDPNLPQPKGKNDHHTPHAPKDKKFRLTQ